MGIAGPVFVEQLLVDEAEASKRFRKHMATSRRKDRRAGQSMSVKGKRERESVCACPKERERKRESLSVNT